MPSLEIIDQEDKLGEEIETTDYHNEEEELEDDGDYKEEEEDEENDDEENYEENDEENDEEYEEDYEEKPEKADCNHRPGSPAGDCSGMVFVKPGQRKAGRAR